MEQENLMENLKEIIQEAIIEITQGVIMKKVIIETIKGITIIKNINTIIKRKVGEEILMVDAVDFERFRCFCVNDFAF